MKSIKEQNLMNYGYLLNKTLDIAEGIKKDKEEV